jgi:hydroxyacylglutathione hydrolase
MVFTGDTIFAGDVGRTDLYGENQSEKMSELLYDSIFNKIIPLGDHVIICPAHGKGSVCGGEISDREYTTIGYERKTNQWLRKSKKQFIIEKTKESHYRPPYFRKMEVLNKNGPPILKNLPLLKPIGVAKLKRHMADDAQIVDIRSPLCFAGSHIPKSLNIWRKGLPMFAGWILNYDKPIIIVDDFNMQLDEVVSYLIRLGYDNVIGYLSGGFFSWEKSAEKSEKIDILSFNDFEKKVNDEPVYILDVREEKNISKQGFIKNANFVYVGELEENLESIPKNKQILVYCDSGFKTSIASSILKKHSYPEVANLMGGFAAWKNAGFSIEK